MLMGIVTKNSILLVEYALVAREKGVERAAALIDACSKRARPIIMTTVAMGAGMLPIALKIGADADFRAPMAIAVIGRPADVDGAVAVLRAGRLHAGRRRQDAAGAAHLAQAADDARDDGRLTAVADAQRRSTITGTSPSTSRSRAAAPWASARLA
jgi:hypothetical protein